MHAPASHSACLDQNFSHRYVTIFPYPWGSARTRPTGARGAPQKIILGFQVTSKAFPNLDVRHVDVPTDREIYDNSKPDLTTLTLLSKFCGCNMELSEENKDQDSDRINISVLSEYAKSLESRVKTRYIQKISVLGVDPVSIPTDRFDPECLPPIEATDLLGYLVLETSYYTKQQLKAFKSLEAFNQMVSGFVTSVRGKIIAGKHVVAKVRHSQRMNDTLSTYG